MNRLGAFGLALLVVLAGCVADKPTPSTPSAKPDPKGVLYHDPIFAVGELSVYDDVVYSKRENRDHLQYTSAQTKQADRATETLNLTMDIQVPPNATATQSQPLVVFIHGGGFVGGSKQPSGKYLASWAQAGYVTASLNYRLTAQGSDTTPELRLFAVRSAVEDVQNAIRFLKTNAAAYHIDPSRIVTLGSSAGGAVSLINAVEFDAPQMLNDFPGTSSRVAAAVSTGATLVNEDLANQPGQFRVDAGDAPVLLLHAKPQDPSTGATWDGSVLPTKRLFDDVGVRCDVVAQPGDEHTADLSLDGDYGDVVVSFVTAELRLP